MMNHTPGPCHANADLIASAPDLLELVKLYQEALLATRAYHSNNNGENARRYKAAMDALPKNWQKEIK